VIKINSEEIRKNLEKKSTDELCTIWRENNRSEWSEEAFDSIRHILIDREIDPPEQQTFTEGLQYSADVGIPFFPTSKTKLVVMSLCTFGIYGFYWFYRNWQFLKDKHKLNIRPFWRAVFSIFFCHSLFKHIKEYAKQYDVQTGISPGWLTFFYILLSISIELPGFAWQMSLLNFLPLLPVQGVINNLNARLSPNSEINKRFSGLNIFGIVIGVILWAIFFLSTPSVYNKHYYQGIEYGVQGAFDSAKVEFEKELKLDSLFTPARECLKIVEDVLNQKIKRETGTHLFKAIDYGNKGKLDEAIGENSKAIEINPEFAEAYISRGVAYLKKGLYDHAINDFSKTLKINPEDAMAYNNRGFAYYSKGLYDQAMADYNKALEINPGHTLAYNNLLTVRQKMKEDEDKRISGKMRISVILVKTKTEAQEFLQKLDAGADFAELAKRYSVGPGKDKKGDLGYFAPGDMMKELNDVAVELKVGEYSEIIETDMGYYIIMKTEEN
jgi:tetratricopeptide (TPR) repeat protein